MTDRRSTGTSKEQAMALRKLQNFIGGEYRDAAEGHTSTLINPSTGEGFAEAPVSGPADVDAAMQAAKRGFEQWRDATPSERRRALNSALDRVVARFGDGAVRRGGHVVEKDLTTQVKRGT